LQPQGDNTKSIDYDALATAIINKLGGDPVTVEHGGTGASTAANARTNLEVPAAIYISGTTWADVFAEVSKVRTNTAATLLISANSASLLTGSAVSNVTFKGVVRRSGSTYDFFALADVSTIYSWRISGLSSASATPTVGNVYEYQSTAKINVADQFSFADGWGGTINAYKRGDVVQLYVAISTMPTLTANTVYGKIIIRDTSVGAATNVFALAQRGSSYNKIGADYLATLPSGIGANDGISIAVGDTVGSGTIRFSMIYILA
jgi:hypothetical protein